ncbi:hypothetical protein ACHQM5_000122 [Ranunculus cassubicifolius]
MDVMKSLKPKGFSTGVFLFVLLGCLLLYLSPDPLQKMQKSWAWRSQFRLEQEELVNILKNASNPNKTVILTTLNEAWADPGSVMDLFLESFRIGENTSHLLHNLVIIAMDEKAFKRCKSIHPHCFSLTTPGINFSSEKRFMTPDYLKLMWRRIDFLHRVLKLGYSFVFTDADIMWFRDPFPYFDSQDEFQIACDHYNGKPRDKGNSANGGFNYVRSSKATIEFYEYWYMAREWHPKMHDQSVFEIIKHEPIVANSGLRIKYFDTMYFGGFCEPSRDLNKVRTMHANCCVGIERKIYDLRLILDDWKNFTVLPPEYYERRNIEKGSPWSAPSECKKWS